MTYETTYHIGYDKHTRKTQAKRIAPAVKRIYPMDATNERHKRNSERQATVCTHSYAANGFLRASFLPKLATTKTVQVCQESTKTERDFYLSLSRLAEHYHIDPMPTQSYGYPYNIALALWQVEEQLKDKVRDWDTIKLVQDSRKAFLTSEERYYTGSTLYYIPIVPLFRMLKNPKQKHAAQLLLSVCSYLYLITDVPYYRLESSYLYWEYEMLKEWVLNDDDTDETDKCRSELEQAEWIGDRMEQKILNHHNLSVFQQRIKTFISRDTLDHDCWLLACKAFDLYEKFPNETIFRNAHAISDEEDIDNIITMDKYISFCADGKGWLNESLEQSVNTDLQEYGQLEEPVISKHFDGSDITGKDLDFENRLFALMEELIYLLNNF